MSGEITLNTNVFKSLVLTEFSMSHTDSEIVVSKTEWERLKKLEEDLPHIIEKTKQERDKERLHELTQRHRENPEEHRRKERERYELKKDIIKAKRREAYKLKKEAEKTSTT